MSDILIPNVLLRQIVDQFGNKSPQTVRIMEISLEKNLIAKEVLLEVFDYLDKDIGPIWPVLATNVWRLSNQPLMTTYFGTSETMQDAITNLLEANRFGLQMFTAEMRPVAGGQHITLSPSEEISQRHWEIFDTLNLMFFSALVKEIAPAEGRQLECYFRQPASVHMAAFAKFFPGSVYFERSTAGIFLSSSFLNKKLQGYNPRINEMIKTETIVQNGIKWPNDEIVFQAKKFLRNHIGKQPTQDHLAKCLNIPTRTLQRLLKTNGTSYLLLKREVFSESVLSMIAMNKSNSEICIRFGFTSELALHNKVKKCFGFGLRKLRRKSFLGSQANIPSINPAKRRS